MRLFVAVFPPPEALDHLAATVAHLNLTRRIIPPERWHITLAFLGDVPLTLPPSTSLPSVAAPSSPPAAPGSPAAGPGSAAGPSSPAAGPGSPAAGPGSPAAGPGSPAAAGGGGGEGAVGGGRVVRAEVVWGALERVQVAVGR